MHFLTEDKFSFYHVLVPLLHFVTQTDNTFNKNHRSNIYRFRISNKRILIW